MWGCSRRAAGAELVLGVVCAISYLSIISRHSFLARDFDFWPSSTDAVTRGRQPESGRTCGGVGGRRGVMYVASSTAKLYKYIHTNDATEDPKCHHPHRKFSFIPCSKHLRVHMHIHRYIRMYTMYVCTYIMCRCVAPARHLTMAPARAYVSVGGNLIIRISIHSPFPDRSPASAEPAVACRILQDTLPAYVACGNVPHVSPCRATGVFPPQGLCRSSSASPNHQAILNANCHQDIHTYK